MTPDESPARLISRLACAAAAVAAAVVLLGFAEAAAAEITVDTTAGSEADERCSLEEAIKAANTDAAVDACPAGDGDDLIAFSAPGVVDAPAGGFQITSNMTIRGYPSAGRETGTVISGPDGFDIVLTAVESSDVVTAVTLADLLISNMTVGGSELGVHVKDDSSAATTTEYTVMLEKLSLYWFGVRVDKAADSGRIGDIVVKDSVVYSRDKGVYFDACDTVVPFNEVALTVSNSVIEGENHSGGIVLDLGGTSFDGQRDYAGLHNDCGHLKVVGSAITGHRNGVSVSGGKLGEGSAAARAASTKTEIINTTIDGNGGAGVSLWKDSGSLQPELLIVNSTITGNNRGGIGTKWEGTGKPGGELFDVEIFNTVVASNGGRQCEFADSLVDDARGGNAASDNSCGFGMVRGDFALGPLSDNGGAAPIGPSGPAVEWGLGRAGDVWTRAFGRHSPLRDAVSGTHCPHEKAPTDARGVSRPQGSGCDIGAYEAKGAEFETRMWGIDRYWTAAAVSRQTFEPGVDVVYVATGEDFPDALAGSAASGGAGPILLVRKDVIGRAASDELKRLKPKRIVVLGGTSVVSAAVEKALQAYTSGKVTRLAGSDRYGTAAVVSAAHFDPGAAVAFVATGADFPDALAGAPAAAELGGPILLSQSFRYSWPPRDMLPAATISELKRLKPKRIVVLGGTGVVSKAVEKALAAYTSGKVTRLAGSDRVLTAVAVSAAHFGPGAPVAFVATGDNFPDALAGGPAAAKLGGPILLTQDWGYWHRPRDVLSAETVSELKRLKPKRIIVLGSTSVVSKAVENAVAAYTR